MDVISDVTLWVGVPVQAGDAWSLVAEGAAGTCVVGPARITCPANGLVTFRWGPGPERTIVGQFALAPGESGVAWALSEAEQADLERWRKDAVTADDPAARRDAVYLLRTWSWQGGSPLPSNAPVPFPSGFLRTLSADPAWQVRRALVELCRDLRDPDGTFADELSEVLDDLAHDRDNRVAKAAFAAQAAAARTERLAPEQAWQRAMEAVDDPGARGRSAALTLAKLSSELSPGPNVNPEDAISRTLASHPEAAWRVWSAWRDAVPYHDGWARTLLTGTTNLNQALLRHWASYEADRLALAITAWEPAPPHSERFGVVAMWLADTPNDELRAALALQ